MKYISIFVYIVSKQKVLTLIRILQRNLRPN